MLVFECTLAADSSPLSPPPTLITFLFLLPPCARLVSPHSTRASHSTRSPHASAGRSYSSARSGGRGSRVPSALRPPDGRIHGDRIRCPEASVRHDIHRGRPCRPAPRLVCVLGLWCTAADGVRVHAGGWGICVRTSSACCALWATYAASGMLPASRWGAWRHLRS
ncbi:hypothetical protein C8J57DRAFT_1325947 [Mycena rebaudengoi]|nr:hypothetical protein C8J57DRAFT_1325947 [Mycena rebaudengoi]